MPWEGVLSYDATYLNNQVAAHCSYGDYHVLFFLCRLCQGMEHYVCMLLRCEDGNLRGYVMAYMRVR